MSFNFSSLAQTNRTIVGHNETDSSGNPAGGYACDGTLHGKLGFHINWQDGPVRRDMGEQPNGAFVEDLLEVCKRRVEFYQQSPFACDENQQALEAIKTAIEALVSRRQDREARGVQGKHEA